MLLIELSFVCMLNFRYVGAKVCKCTDSHTPSYDHINYNHYIKIFFCKLNRCVLVYQIMYRECQHHTSKEQYLKGALFAYLLSQQL